MSNSNLSKDTQCVHTGGIEDSAIGGVVSPIYPSTAYNYVDADKYMYPRYFNIPNHTAVEQKLAAIESTENAVLFSSGMAATMTVLLTFLQKGDHVFLQSDLYGGTNDAVSVEMKKFGIEYTFAPALKDSLIKNIQPNTKVIFIESPSNPLLKVTDIREVVALAKEKQIITVMDNTFASPINQNPHNLGIDIVIHSGTKYLGGHSDICCGIACMSDELTSRVRETGVHYGGNLDAQAAWLLERSLKTLHLRVSRQNENALAIAKFLSNHPKVENVYYPGLENDPYHQLASNQMSGFGGMLAFEVAGNPDMMVKRLKLIKPAMSLGGVESTIGSPSQTSHARIGAQQREELGIKDNLLRMSVGVENATDLIADLEKALE
ncbi:MAG: aminotransferase class I/II-fold pyridoxal phosphate-dependent enzyme [Cyclobacteriaceae bacterium]|nr:aminotransferase class I/II-fold pyridoxal phosphate-dependent enzyme [Cyclobacteriaceae bacterium]